MLLVVVVVNNGSLVVLVVVVIITGFLIGPAIISRLGDWSVTQHPFIPE